MQAYIHTMSHYFSFANVALSKSSFGTVSIVPQALDRLKHGFRAALLVVYALMVHVEDALCLED